LLVKVLVMLNQSQGASKRIFQVIDREAAVPSRGGETLQE